MTQEDILKLFPLDSYVRLTRLAPLHKPDRSGRSVTTGQWVEGPFAIWNLFTGFPPSIFVAGMRTSPVKSYRFPTNEDRTTYPSAFSSGLPSFIATTENSLYLVQAVDPKRSGEA